MKKFSGLSIYRKRGKKTAHAIDRMRGPKSKIRKKSETGTGDFKTGNKHVELVNGE